MPGLIGKKLGMSQVLQDDGRVIPVTFIQCNANSVVQVKTTDKDGYPAIVLGFDAYKNPSKNSKFKVTKEFRVAKSEDFQKGQELNVTALNDVKEVSVVGISKGKGFQGVVKRHNFSRGPESHGSGHHRQPGSSGCRAKPGRVRKGKKYPGQMGGDQVTLMHRPVVSIHPEHNMVAIKGAIPGTRNGYVFLNF